MSEVRTLEELEDVIGISLRSYYADERVEHPALLLAAVIDNLAGAVAEGVPRAVQDACILLSVDPKLPFGKGLKARLARALKSQTELMNEVDRSRIVASTSKLLSLEYCPGEAEEYCRLVRRMGPESAAAVVASAHPKSEKGRHMLRLLGLPTS